MGDRLGGRRWRGRLFALLASAAIAGAASADDGVQASRPFRIGVLNDALAANHPAVEGLKTGLRELGLVEGRDVAFEFRFTQGSDAAAREGALALAEANVDLIFTSSEVPTREAIQATSKIPIVFTLVGDPVAAGFVDGFAAPKGNATGISDLSPELAPKRLELLKTLAPETRRVWMVHEATDRVAAAAVARARPAAEMLGIELLVRQVHTREEVASIASEIRGGDAILASDRGRIDVPGALLDVALAARLPAAFTAPIYVGYGGLVSYGADYFSEGFQAARLVARIAGGARPQDLPVEGADKLDVALNLKSAADLGLVVPRKLLLRADTLRR